MMPSAAPERPTWIAASTISDGECITRGKQSAELIARASPLDPVMNPSVSSIVPPRFTNAISVPCTCPPLTTRFAPIPRIFFSLRLFSRTSVRLSPTWLPRFRESKGGMLTPPPLAVNHTLSAGASASRAGKVPIRRPFSSIHVIISDKFC